MTLLRVSSPAFLGYHLWCHGFPHKTALLTIRYWSCSHPALQLCPLQPSLELPATHWYNLPAIVSLPQVDLDGMPDLANMRHTLMERVQRMMGLCCGYRSTFSQYSHLYVEDQKEVLGQFLLYGHILTPEEIEDHVEDGIPESPPLLSQFKVQIDSYETLYEEVCRLEPIKVFDSWMKIDIQPFKASLLNIIKRWSLLFKQHLVDHVTQRYDSCFHFLPAC